MTDARTIADFLCSPNIANVHLVKAMGAEFITEEALWLVWEDYVSRMRNYQHEVANIAHGIWLRSDKTAYAFRCRVTAERELGLSATALAMRLHFYPRELFYVNGHFEELFAAVPQQEDIRLAANAVSEQCVRQIEPEKPYDLDSMPLYIDALFDQCLQVDRGTVINLLTLLLDHV